MNTPIRIVMIGGGYLSFGAWKQLRRTLRRELARDRVQVTVIGSHNYHYFHGFIGEMISGVVSVGSGMSAARSIFAGARFITGKVSRVDTGMREVFFTTGDGAELSLPYDHLVVGLGARYRRDAVPGLGEFGWALRDIGAVQGLRNHVIGCFERAEAAREESVARRALTFVIAGGGFAVVEITAALAELVEEMRTHYPVLRRTAPRIVLVHSGRRILPEMADHQRLVGYAERHLEHYGVDVVLATRVARVEAARVWLSSGAVIETDTVLSTVGNVVTPLPGLDSFPVDEQRRLYTNKFLQVSGAANIWAGGDCAHVARARSADACPTNALWAIKHGECIGRNLARAIRGKTPRPFGFLGLGTAASMGTGKGMGELFGVVFTGWLAWVMRLLVFLYFMPSRRQASGVLLEHCKLPFCGRGIVPLDVSVPGKVQPSRPARVTGARQVVFLGMGSRSGSRKAARALSENSVAAW